jgi:hypothetical protein
MGPRPCSSAFLANTAAEQARSGREYLLPGQLLVGWAMTVVADHESGPQGSPPAAGPGGQGRLRRSDPGAGGIRRRRRGRGFRYLDSNAPVTDPRTLARIRALVISPAWEDQDARSPPPWATSAGTATSVTWRRGAARKARC